MSNEKTLVSSGTKWEDIIGYSRAVRVGNVIEVSGTVAVDENGLVAPGNPYLQTRFIIEKIERALKEAGASLKDVIRTRIYVVEIEETWDDIGRAHGEFFKDIKPASTMIEVKSLIDPDMLVEIEATAVVNEE